MFAALGCFSCIRAHHTLTLAQVASLLHSQRDVSAVVVEALSLLHQLCMHKPAVTVIQHTVLDGVAHGMSVVQCIVTVMRAHRDTEDIQTLVRVRLKYGRDPAPPSPRPSCVQACNLMEALSTTDSPHLCTASATSALVDALCAHAGHGDVLLASTAALRAAADASSVEGMSTLASASATAMVSHLEKCDLDASAARLAPVANMLWTLGKMAAFVPNARTCQSSR